ncbi:MAG: histidine kinase dimerization/phospho-acceptor domain-containing protein [Microvirga sp.]
MRFDDRLATVLAQPVGSPRERAIRWRQLVDLVARSGGRGDPALQAEAIAAIAADAPQVDEDVRGATARAISGLTIPLPLLAIFAADRLAVAAPLLVAAPLDVHSLVALRAAASDEVRPFLDSLAPPAPPAAEPAAPPAPKAAPEPPKPVAKAEPVPSISEVVARIERLRSSREQSAAARPVGLGVAGSPALFRWECNPSGEIDWVEGAPRGALVGRSIAAADEDDGVDDRVERAFGIRAPFRDCTLELGDDGPLAGQWVISGVPAFSSNDGRFIGYRGVARRDEPEEHVIEQVVPSGALSPDHDSLREMIHEIKTPLNAIIGFAEIIDGQYFGPAHSRYRERAAEIVANARSLLEAAEDLDFAARLQSARSRPGEGTDFKSFFPGFAEALLARAARQGITLDIDAPDSAGRCALDPELIERLLRRFTDAVLSASSAGERLVVNVRREGQRLIIGITRPKATLLAGKDELLDPEFTIGEADRAMLGLGFSLRLVNGLVGIAGGALEIGASEFALGVPLTA